MRFIAQMYYMTWENSTLVIHAMPSTLFLGPRSFFSSHKMDWTLREQAPLARVLHLARAGHDAADAVGLLAGRA